MAWINSLAQPPPSSSSWFATCVWWTSGKTFWCPWHQMLVWLWSVVLPTWVSSFIGSSISVFCCLLGTGQGQGSLSSPAGSSWQESLALTLQVLVAGSPDWTPAATEEIQCLDFRPKKCESSGTWYPRAKFNAILGGQRRGRQLKNPTKPTQNIFYFKYASD